MNTEKVRTKLYQLRSQTAEIERELDLRKQLEVEAKRNLAATMKLKAANRLSSEQKEYDEEVRHLQIGLSRVTSVEQHPDWRLQENSNLEFYRQQILPGGKKKF